MAVFVLPEREIKERHFTNEKQDSSIIILTTAIYTLLKKEALLYMVALKIQTAWTLWGKMKGRNRNCKISANKELLVRGEP